MARNSNLHRAKKEKNDEFYTIYEDIEKEMINYIPHFKNQIIYCPCDDWEVSNFTKYFMDNFEKFQLKKLICTSYSKDGNGKWFIYDGEKKENGLLEGNGDFRSQECIELLKEADIVVTNPPFSLFRDFVAQLMQYEKKFIILGNMNAITCKEIFPLIKENKLRTGVTSFCGKMPFFRVPAEFVSENDRVEIRADGIYKQVNAIWFTNLPHAKRNRPLDLYKKYNAEEYPKYDNYLGFECSKVADIPIDDFIDIEIPDEDFEKWKSVYGDDLEIIN